MTISVKCIGFKGGENNMATKTLKIEGMTCASCAKAVERASKRLQGVKEANVNFATEKLSISFDDSSVSIPEIQAAVEKAGYKALEEETAVDTDKVKKEKEMKHLWKRFIISAIFTILLLYISMGLMIGLPLPGFISPETNPLAFALAQLFLVIPVVISGYRFYTVGFKTLIRKSPNMDSLIAIGTSAAVLYGIYATIKISAGNTSYAMDLYFESAAVIITLITLGKYLESVSKGKTSEAIKKLMGLAPKTAVVIRNGKETEIKSRKLK
jgi:Cu+-exporting ATPase